MINHKKTVIILKILFSITLISLLLFGQVQNRILGKISIIPSPFANKKYVNLDTFRIELRKIEVIRINSQDQRKPGGVLFTTYPDFYGFFTFKNVPEDNYILQTSFIKAGESRINYKVLYQVEIDVKYINGKCRLNPITLIF